MATGSLFQGLNTWEELIPPLNWFLVQESILPVLKFPTDTLRKKEKVHVLNEKSIPASKIEVSRSVGDSNPHLVPTWFFLGSSDSPRSCWDCSASAVRHGAQRRSQSASVPACLSFSEKRKTFLILPSTEYIFYCKRAILLLSSSKILTPPTPSPPGESVLPPQQRRGVHTRRAERGVNILEDGEK